jgi:flagellar biosynthesis/type III secretory pathway M-ring protein FliF/YscJ
VLGVLALVSLAMMAMLVRKATKKAELPTAEELVGIPPALQADGDLYGEADEGDVPMSGIELDEEQVRSSKMLEQVGELVKSSPETAAGLLQSWISASED